MVQTMCSNETLSLASMGLTHKEFIQLYNLGYSLDLPTICSIFDMQPNEVSEVYRQAGLCRPFIEPRSIEALYCAMLWLYITGRAQFGLNAFCKIEYLGGAIKKADRAFIDMEQFEPLAISARLKSVLNVPESHGWMTKYIADAIVSASEDERRSILSDLILNGRHSIVRQDYQPLDRYINLDGIRHRRRRICYSKFQLYCVLDRTRIEACHVYKGGREDFGLAIWGSSTNRDKILSSSYIPIMCLDTGLECSKVLLKCLKLGI